MRPECCIIGRKMYRDDVLVFGVQYLFSDLLVMRYSQLDLVLSNISGADMLL
jgi:hypothetical protein